MVLGNLLSTLLRVIDGVMLVILLKIVEEDAQVRSYVSMG